jgi:hypothetical protein
VGFAEAVQQFDHPQRVALPDGVLGEITPMLLARPTLNKTTNSWVASTTASECSGDSTGSNDTQVKIAARWKARSAAIRSPGCGAACSNFSDNAPSRVVSVAAWVSRSQRNRSRSRRARVPPSVRSRLGLFVVRQPPVRLVSATPFATRWVGLRPLRRRDRRAAAVHGLAP